MNPYATTTAECPRKWLTIPPWLKRFALVLSGTLAFILVIGNLAYLVYLRNSLGADGQIEWLEVFRWMAGMR